MQQNYEGDRAELDVAVDASLAAGACGGRPLDRFASVATTSSPRSASRIGSKLPSATRAWAVEAKPARPLYMGSQQDPHTGLT